MDSQHRHTQKEGHLFSEDERKSYEAPVIQELGDVSELTNFDVSVNAY